MCLHVCDDAAFATSEEFGYVPDSDLLDSFPIMIGISQRIDGAFTTCLVRIYSQKLILYLSNDRI